MYQAWNEETFSKCTWELFPQNVVPMNVLLRHHFIISVVAYVSVGNDKFHFYQTSSNRCLTSTIKNRERSHTSYDTKLPIFGNLTHIILWIFIFIQTLYITNIQIFVVCSRNKFILLIIIVSYHHQYFGRNHVLNGNSFFHFLVKLQKPVMSVF